MCAYKKDYTMSDDKVYNKLGKIVTMLDDLQTTGCFEPGYTQPVYRIAVTGPNGAGKDSFINCLFGYTFLPANCKTKRQMEIRFMHSIDDVSPMVQIDELNKKFTHFTDCSKKIAELQNGTNDSNQSIAIRMTLTSNTSADLYVISTCEQDVGNPYASTMLKEALGPSSNFIVLVLEAIYLNDDHKQKRDHWFDLIRNYDPDLERTMVVFTKCDILPNNFNFNKIKAFLRDSNDVFNPKYGFVCVKTNFMAHIEPSDQVRMEREYFCNHKTFGYLNINDYFTLDTAGEKITKWIYETRDFKKTMVHAYSKMQERMKFVDSELDKFGKDFLDFSTQRKDLYLQGMMNVFCQTVEKVFAGNCDMEEYNFTNVKINKLYVEFLGDYTDYKPSISFQNEKIIDAIQKTEGCGLSGFPNGDVIYALLDPKLEELRDELNTYAEDIYTTVNQLFKTIINRFFARFPKALNSIEELIISFLDQEFNKTRDLFNDLAEMNFTYLYVDELSKEYKNLIQDSLLKKGFQNQSNQSGLDSSNQNPNFPFKENKDISFFKSLKDKDRDSYYQGLANYVKSLVDFIYSEMIRTLREYIPKATGNFFIKSLKTNMNFYLLQHISKNPDICQDLEEDQDVAQKRVYYIDAQKKLKKINKMVGLDEQIAKFFKEDNIKNIDNILQAQGIDSRNAQENEELEKEKEKERKKNKPSIINEIGVPPKKETPPEKTTNNPPKTNISQASKNNLFGNAPSKPNINKSTNLFGNSAQSKNDNTNPAPKKNPSNSNLFGSQNTTAQNSKKQTNTQSKTNNLFGTPSQPTGSKSTNLFGNTNNANKTPKTNQQNQNQKQGNKDNNKDLKVSLKIDPKEGNISGVNVQGNIDPQDAYNFYQKNKQYMPSGQQMLSGAQTVGNFMSQQNNNNNNAANKAKVGALASLFGSK